MLARTTERREGGGEPGIDLASAPRIQLGHAPLFAVTFLRLVSRRGAMAKLAELPAFLRYRLRNRREPAIVAVRKLKRTVRRAVVQSLRGWLS